LNFKQPEDVILHSRGAMRPGFSPTLSVEEEGAGTAGRLVRPQPVSPLA
jgi:hypothetical protein